MGADQHYVPVFITKAFSNFEVLKHLPPGSQGAEAHYRMALENRLSRKLPVLIYDKFERRLVVRPTLKVCVARHLYSIPEFDDPEAAGIALSIVEKFVGLSLPRPAHDGELLEWARRVGGSGIAREIIETAINSRIECHASDAITRIREEGRIRQEDTRALALFVDFSMARVPNWRAHNNVALAAAARQRFESSGPVPVRPEHLAGATRVLRLYEEVAGKIAYQMLLCTFLSDDVRNNPLLARRRFRMVLFRSSDVPFIQCDNPARPLSLSHAQRAPGRPAPGLKEPDSFVIYPISPRYVLGFTTDPKYSHLSVVRLTRREVQRVNSALLKLVVREVILPFLRTDLFPPGVTLDAAKPFVEKGDPFYTFPIGK